MSENQTTTPQTQLSAGAYELIRNRLQNRGRELQEKLLQLDALRKQVFGSIEIKLLNTERVTTENNCIPRDIVPVGDHFLLGYNVALGLKSEINPQDVFSVFYFDDAKQFHIPKQNLLADKKFEADFKDFYRYYKNASFAKFTVKGNFLYMVFQAGAKVSDVKTFKWLAEPDHLTYVNNRSEQEIKYPPQYDFTWTKATREMRRTTKPPLCSLHDKLFVGLDKGFIVFKVDDNTDKGEAVYRIPVTHADQTLDDLDLQFAILENLIALKIRPYREEKYRYLIYNIKLREVVENDKMAEACIQLPDNHGLVFANGYYLQTGEMKLFDLGLTDMVFEKRIVSPNGEDFAFVFYNLVSGTYLILPYNLIRRSVDSPIVCHGYSFFEDGELIVFRAETEPTKNHSLQIYSTPFVGANYLPAVTSDSFIYKVGNKNVVECMADCYQILALSGKEDNYSGLYFDLIKQTGDVLDSYPWLGNDELFGLTDTLREIRQTAQAAIDEFEKVQAIKKNTAEALNAALKKVSDLTHRMRHTTYDRMDQYVANLVDVRKLRGEVVSLRELRYADLGLISKKEEELAEFADSLSRSCVEFLLQPDSLKDYSETIDRLQKEIESATKTVDLTSLSEQTNAAAEQLQALIEIVSNLKISDATQTTAIIDNISALLARLNQTRARLNNRKKELFSLEGKAEFGAQLKLIQQAVVNYLDVAETPARCDEMLNKLTVQIEELGSKFAEFDEFIIQISDKRQEVYDAFEAKKLQLVDARNKRSQSLTTAAERILKAVEQRAAAFKEIDEINGYFAADLMVAKVREITQQLYTNEDSVRASDLEGRLKKAQSDALTQLKDKKELFLGGENVIKFGEYHFAVNTLALELTILQRDDQMFFHLTGTNFFERIDNEDFNRYKNYWNQDLISEDRNVYRGEFLAYKLFAKMLESGETEKWAKAAPDELLAHIQQYMATRYAEGYLKGVTDRDAQFLLSALLKLHQSIDLLRFSPTVRACATVFWNAFLEPARKEPLRLKLLNLGLLRKTFPDSKRFEEILAQLEKLIAAFCNETEAFEPTLAAAAAHYLFEEITGGKPFIAAAPAAEMYRAFQEYLTQKDLKKPFFESLSRLEDAPAERLSLIRVWLNAFVDFHPELDRDYLDEAAALFFLTEEKDLRLEDSSVVVEVQGLSGSHSLIENGKYTLHYNHFIDKMRQFLAVNAPQFKAFSDLKKQLVSQYRDQLGLEQFTPKVMSAFVRNRLIDSVYLPLIGANLAKQIGVVGANKRTDFQGLLMLISPPGYGKTTLMEYICNRLGLLFVKINGPAIGHRVTSLDPAEAPNASARIEVERLNLALEMGDNVMIYVDDIQHCNPEFLQKFISLCDAQRKIEGVYKGKSKVYDLRGKKVVVCMAGNPYTESGHRFQAPDMLVNRADTYNLGDIIGDTQTAFELSYIENALTANAVLRPMVNKSREDLYRLVRMAETGQPADSEFDSAISPEEAQEMTAVLKKLLAARNIVLKVNKEYILSANQSDEFRTEPAFKLQGSYRNMSKLADKIVPMTSDAELTTLILAHYEQELQTLTNGAEANLLKLKEICGWLTEKDSARWEEIKTAFRRNQLTRGFGENDRMGQAIAQLVSFNEHLSHIKETVKGALAK